MKKTLKNKLALDRETLTALQSDELGAINGGIVSDCFRTMIPPCGGGASNLTSKLLGCSRQVSIGGGQ
jgi:hypothetical protein